MIIKKKTRVKQQIKFKEVLYKVCFNSEIVVGLLNVVTVNEPNEKISYFSS